MSTEAQPSVIVPGKLLGKKAVKFDPRTLRLARYVTARKLPKIPKAHTLSKLTKTFFKKFGMMRNDEFGCCTCSSFGHLFQQWSVYGRRVWSPTDAAVLELYSRVNGGTDDGAAMLDVLNEMRKVGILEQDPAHPLVATPYWNKIHAFVAVDPTNKDQLKTGHFLFGGVYLGANLPVSAQGQKVWDVGEGPAFSPGSWGGHCMSVIDYDDKGLTVVTWGELQKMTWEWVARYCDEAYVILEEDYVGADNRSPQGFSLAKLAKDIKGL